MSKYDWKKKVQLFAKKFTDEEWEKLCLDMRFLKCLSPEGLDLLRAEVIAQDLMPNIKFVQPIKAAKSVASFPVSHSLSTIGDDFDSLAPAGDQLDQRKSVER